MMVGRLPIPYTGVREKCDAPRCQLGATMIVGYRHAPDKPLVHGHLCDAHLAKAEQHLAKKRTPAAAMTDTD